MTLPRINMLNKYWRQHPPLSLLVEGFVGWKVPAAEDPDTSETPGDISSLVGIPGVRIDD